MKLLEWLIKMAKKLLNLDTDNGEQSWEDGGALPNGTVNQTLRHNGTEWVANSTLQNFGNGTVRIEGASQGIITIKGGAVRSEYGANSSGGFINQYDGGGYLLSSISMGTDITINQSRSTTAKFSLLFPMVADVNRKIFEIDLGFSVYKDYRIKSNYLSGTGSALLEATADGTIQRSATVLPTRTEYLSGLLTGTEHTFTGTTLGITGDLRSRIKNIKCFAVDSSGNFNGALIDNEFIYETDLVVNSATNLSGSFSIKLFIEYV